MVSDSNTLFEKLGLTEYEAKTLNTLFKLKEAEAPDISRSAQVPKTRVYDVLERLIEKNLIIEIKGRPKSYRAITPQKAIDSLVLAKKDQVSALEKEATEMKNNLVNYDVQEESGEKIMKVKDRGDFEKILAQELLKANKTIHGMTEITDDHKVLHDALQKMKEKKVVIRLLNSQNSKKLRESAEVKIANHGLNAFIIDDKKVVLGISDFKKQRPEYSFVILNEHQPVANALTHYFDKHWNPGKC